MTGDAIRRVIRTFIITFLVTVGPGFLGWFHSLTEWANSHGQTPLPDGKALAWIGVSAVLAAIIAAGNLLWVAVEDWLGKGLLRTPPPIPTKEG